MREAVVLARDGANGKQLVGYVVPQDVGALEDEKRGALRGAEVGAQGEPAGIHGADPVGVPGGAAADAQRQAGPQGATGAGRQ